MTRPPGALASTVFADAKALLAAGDVAAALERYRAAFEELVLKGEHYDASNIAHMAGVADGEPATKHLWNILALREADAEADRASVAGFYPSLYHNLAYSHLQLGEKDDGRRCLEQAWAHVGALEPGPYGDRVRAAIKQRLDELTR